MIYATPPAPPAIVHQLPAPRAAVTRTPVVAIPVVVPRYRARAAAAGWPFRTTRADANAVAVAVLRALRRDGVSVSRVQVRQADGWSDVPWLATVTARGEGASMYRRMHLQLNRRGRGLLGTMVPPPVRTVDCCRADTTRGGGVG